MFLPVALYEVGGSLRDHDGRGVRVARYDAGHYRGVDDAQTCDAVNAQIGVHHLQRIKDYNIWMSRWKVARIRKYFIIII